MRTLSNKEKKSLIDLIPKGYTVSKKDTIKEEDGILYKNGEVFLLLLNDNYFPHLKSIPQESYKSVYVDKGSIPFLIKGADLMRPGIVEIEDNIEKDEVILIKDYEHQKTIALGISLYNSKELNNIEKGKVIKVYHYVGDNYYN